MLAAPSIAIDLPLKILIWEDDQGKVWVSYNSTRIFGRAARSAPPFNAKYRHHRHPGRQHRGVTLKCGFMPESTLHDQIAALAQEAGFSTAGIAPVPLPGGDGWSPTSRVGSSAAMPAKWST